MTLSILWSMKTAISTYLKIKGVQKGGFLPFKSKAVLGCRIFLVTVCRIGAIFFYFAVFLGQLNMLAHWKAEQTSFQMLDGWTVKSPNDWIHESFSYWSEQDKEISSVPFQLLYRSNYSTTPPTPPSYTMYTGIDLGTAFILFWILLVIQTMILMAARLLTCKRFRKIGIFSKLVHCLDSVNIPDVYQDWDTEDGYVLKCYQRQFKSVMTQMGSMVIIQYSSGCPTFVCSSHSSTLVNKN